MHVVCTELNKQKEKARYISPAYLRSLARAAYALAPLELVDLSFFCFSGVERGFTGQLT